LTFLMVKILLAALPSVPSATRLGKEGLESQEVSDFMPILYEDTESFSVNSVVPYVLPFFIKLLTISPSPKLSFFPGFEHPFNSGQVSDKIERIEAWNLFRHRQDFLVLPLAHLRQKPAARAEEIACPG
jgi:hypothetical protein